MSAINPTISVLDSLQNILTVEFSIENFSKITQGQKFLSSKYTVNNLSWQVSIQRRKGDQNKLGQLNDTMAVFMYAIPPSTNSILWSCFASIRFSLISQKSVAFGRRDHSLEFHHIFTSAASNSGYNSLIDWSSVTDPEGRFISNDSVKFQVRIEADFPKNIISDSNVARPQSLDNWFHVLESKFCKRIVNRVSDEFKELNATIKEDPVVDSIRNEIISLEKRNEKIYSYLQLLNSMPAKLNSLEKKIEEFRSDTTVALDANICSKILALENKLENFYLERNVEIKAIEKKLEKVYLDLNSEIKAFGNNCSDQCKSEALGRQLEQFSSDIIVGLKAFEKKMEKFCSDVGTDIKTFEKKMETSCLIDHGAQAEAIDRKMEKFSLDLNVELKDFENTMKTSCLEYFAKVADELKKINSNKNEANDDDLSKKKAVCESKQNLNRKEDNSKQVDTVKEKTVSVSVLNLLKEILVQQQPRILFNHIPHSSLVAGIDHERSVLHSYQPVMREPEFHLSDDLLHPSIYENSFVSFLQAGDLSSSKYSEMKQTNSKSSCNTAEQQLRKIEKRKNEEVMETNNDDTFVCSNKTKMSKLTILQDEVQQVDSSQEVLFLAKNEAGDVRIHKIKPHQLEDLKKKYKNYKISRIDDF